MEVIKTSIDGVVIIEPKVFKDARGYFFESFSQREFEEKVRKINFVQDNESMSPFGVMRGLHFQRPPYTQAKLVRCMKGAVLDVAVDIRKGSPTYGQYVASLLCGSDMNDEEAKKKLSSSSTLSYDEITAAINRQFFIDRGFAHGFAVLSDTAIFLYKCDNFYNPLADGGISILDESLGIDWKIPTDNVILSDKDTRHPLLKDFDSPFSY
ncbi:MAG: dTDP-4-dehydrorhamnose 3,5-epimerase family protein [Prevotellaceae bacterium]|nr:dTDP-4-dehydrorhamnose 3,5-epimerase family protein [Candidatus Minthosoma equi]